MKSFLKTRKLDLQSGPTNLLGKCLALKTFPYKLGIWFLKFLKDSYIFVLLEQRMLYYLSNRCSHKTWVCVFFNSPCLKTKCTRENSLSQLHRNTSLRIILVEKWLTGRIQSELLQRSLNLRLLLTCSWQSHVKYNRQSLELISRDKCGMVAPKYAVATE